jgi:small subunit ribosomal protein S1
MPTKTQSAENNSMKIAIDHERSLFQSPKEGDIVEGPIITKEGGEVYIDLGLGGTGIIYGREYFESQDKLKDKKKGDRISAKIVELENDEGLRELSLSEAGRETSWQKLARMRDSQELVSVKITDANRGGLMIEKEGIEGFLPVSQLAPAHYPRVEGGDKEKILKEIQQYIGQTMEVRILDTSQSQNKFIVSEKAGEEESIKKALEKYKIGDVVKGQVTGVVDFGAFIRLDPLVEGLVHISELDWQLVNNPRDIVKVGDKIEAKIVDVAKDGRISLSIKALKEDPWKDLEKKYPQGKAVRGIISKLTAYGTLVRLEEGIQGLVHISEFASEEEMREKLEEGKEYKFEVSQIVPEERRIALKLAVA